MKKKLDKAMVCKCGKTVVKTVVGTGVIATSFVTIGMKTVGEAIETVALVPAIVCVALNDVYDKI